MRLLAVPLLVSLLIPVPASAGDFAASRPVRVLSAYLRTNTVVPPILPAEPNPGHFPLLVEEYAKPLGLTWQVLDGRTLLVRWIPAKPSGKAPMLFLNHADVVPVDHGEDAAWTHPPFAGTVADGYVWGRGAIDNKSSGVAILEAIARLKAADMEPDREIQLLVTPDEEIGGVEGAKRYIAVHMETYGRPEFVLDEGSYVVPDFVPGRNQAMVAVGEKSYLTIRVSVEGHGGHSSMPHGDSAPTILTRALAKLNAYEFPVTILPPVEGLLDAMGAQVAGVQGFALRNRWLTGPLVTAQLTSKPASNAVVRNTMALTMVRTGVKDNVIPSRAEAFYNLRLLPDTDVDAVLATLHDVVGDERVRIETHDYWGNTPLAPAEGELWDALKIAVEKEIPNGFLASGISPATTDSRWFAQAGIPSYRLLPFTLDAAERATVHGKNERLSLANFEQGIRFYRTLIEALAGE